MACTHVGVFHVTPMAVRAEVLYTHIIHLPSSKAESQQPRPSSWCATQYAGMAVSGGLTSSRSLLISSSFSSYVFLFSTPFGKSQQRGSRGATGGCWHAGQHLWSKEQDAGLRVNPHKARTPWGNVIRRYKWYASA